MIFKHYTSVIIVIVIIASAIFVLFGTPTAPKSETTPINSLSTPTPSRVEKADFTAQFLIYTLGTKRIFTAPMYHALSPDVFITEENPEIVYVKKLDTTWGDFFSTLPMGLTKTCLTTGTGQRFCTNQSQELQFYINEEKVSDALEKVIQPGDKLLITYTGSNSAVISQQLNSFVQIQQ